MQILSLCSLGIVLFVLCRRTHQKPIELAPYLVCGISLILYFLGFFRLLSGIDWILCFCGIIALADIAVAIYRKGWASLLQEFFRQWCDPYLWGCVLWLAVLCIALRGELLLEWDAYSLWGPATKSLFYQNGYAPLHGNVAIEFGDYPPATQLILWWFNHLLGSYQEMHLYWGYFIFSGSMLYSAGAAFWQRATKGRAFLWILIPFLALCVPGVCSVAWYRSIYVDPVMAILFGMILCAVLMRPQNHVGFWKGKLLVACVCLTLMKGIGLLWAVLAAVFYLLWWSKERREWKFFAALLTAPMLFSISWSIYCRIMQRTGYLTGYFLDRFSLLFQSSFWKSEQVQGYLRSYLQAFFNTPVHREKTVALDLSLWLILLLFLIGVVVLWYVGAVPAKKWKRLLAYVFGVPFLSVLIVWVGQLTMFFYETQYLDPVAAVTLLSRYCEPAFTGLLMLLLTFTLGDTSVSSAAPFWLKKQRLLSGVAAVLLVCTTGYSAAYQRFVYDALDASRVEKRQSFENVYSEFLSALEEIPYQQKNSRVLLVRWEAEMNPIVYNAASPVAVSTVALGKASDPTVAFLDALAETNSGFVYFYECDDVWLQNLSAETQNDILYSASHFDIK